VPIGGTANQVLSKIDATDFNTQWVNYPPTATANRLAQFNNAGDLSDLGEWIVSAGNVQSIAHQTTFAAPVTGFNLFAEYTDYAQINGTYGAFQSNPTIALITGGGYNGFVDIPNLVDVDQHNGFIAGGIVTNANQYASGFQWNRNITNALQGVTGYNDAAFVGDMPTLNNSYTSINLGPNVATGVGKKTFGFQSLSVHPQVGKVIYDVSLIEDGSSFASVGRNANVVNIHPAFTEIVDNYNGLSLGPQVTKVSGGSHTDLGINSKSESVANSYNGISLNPQQITQATAAPFDFSVTCTDDVAGSLAGKFWTFSIPYAVGGTNYAIWLEVGGVGTAPVGYGTTIQVTVANNDTAATIATAMDAAMNGVGALTAEATITNPSSGVVQVVSLTSGAATTANAQQNYGAFDIAYTTYGAGLGDASGLNIYLGNVSWDRYKKFALRTNGGRIETQLDWPLANEPNAMPVNSFGTNFTAAASAVIANADNFGTAFNTNVQLGDSAAITSGAFGVGTAAAGGLMLLQLDNGSSIADACGSFVATLPI
jgi:hypothetical protein